MARETHTPTPWMRAALAAEHRARVNSPARFYASYAVERQFHLETADALERPTPVSAEAVAQALSDAEGRYKKLNDAERWHIAKFIAARFTGMEPEED